MLMVLMVVVLMFVVKLVLVVVGVGEALDYRMLPCNFAYWRGKVSCTYQASLEALLLPTHWIGCMASCLSKGSGAHRPSSSSSASSHSRKLWRVQVAFTTASATFGETQSTLW